LSAKQTKTWGDWSCHSQVRHTPWKDGGWIITVFTMMFTLKGLSATNLVTVKSVLKDKLIDLAVDRATDTRQPYLRPVVKRHQLHPSDSSYERWRESSNHQT
jgi:hypothetical protein